MKLLFILLALATASLVPTHSTTFNGTREKALYSIDSKALFSYCLFRTVWLGLQPASKSMVFQTVITNEIPETWQFYLAQCCTPQQAYSSFQEIYPSDKVTSEFIRGDKSGNWTVFWSLENHTTSATIRNAVGNIDLEMQGSFDHMMFAIETATSSAWDSEPITWTDITMEADHSWCIQLYHTVLYNLTGPITSDVGGPGLTTCHILYTEVNFL